jgi:glycosyltransferase involved in cell wall biosynthesis
MQSPSVGDKVVVVPNAVDEVFLEETKRQPRLRDGLQSNQLIKDKELNAQKDQEAKTLRDGKTEGRPVRILFVGRIHPEKGLELLVQALKSMERGAGSKEQEAWECVLVGPVAQSEGGGGETFADELKRQVEGLPVRFEAPVFDPEALAKIYDKADVFVYPSVAEMGESFGIAPLEAMARGLVPVVSDLAVFRQYIEPGVNGIVFDHRPATAPAQLAAAIDSLLQDPARRKAMAAKARQTAETYSLSATADRYLSLFAKITEEPR